MNLLKVFFLIAAGVFSGRIENNPQMERLRVGLRNAIIVLAIAPNAVYVLKWASNSTAWSMPVSFILALLVLATCLSARRIIAVAWFNALLSALGITLPPQPPQPGQESTPQTLFSLFWDAILYILFYEMIFLFYLPQMNHRLNPYLWPLFLIGGVAVMIFYPKGKLFRGLATIGVVICLIFHFLAVIPPYMWIQAWGSDPIAPLRLTTVQEALADAHAKEAKTAADNLTKKVREAEDSLASGILRKNLPTDQKEALEQAERENPGLIKKAWKGISSMKFPATIGGGGGGGPSGGGSKLKPRVIKAASAFSGRITIPTEKYSSAYAAYPACGKVLVGKGGTAKYKFNIPPGEDCGQWVFRITARPKNPVAAGSHAEEFIFQINDRMQEERIALTFYPGGGDREFIIPVNSGVIGSGSNSFSADPMTGPVYLVGSIKIERRT